MADAGSEARRIEDLWRGEFGDAYVARNIEAGAGRGDFWERCIVEFPIQSALEVGCNIGANLWWICQRLPAQRVYGVDVNAGALKELRRRLPAVNALRSAARLLPFRDRQFDLVFTTGVLIHQPPDGLAAVMREIVRCARRYVLCGEYYAAEPTGVEYHGQNAALWKRDFGGMYQALFPSLTLRRTGFLPRSQGGWDDVTFWIFEKPA